MDILFDLTAAGSGRVDVIGTMTRPRIVKTIGPVDLIGVRFRPGGLSKLCALDAAELTDGREDLTNFWGRLAPEAWQRLGEAHTGNRIGLLRTMLEARASRLHRSDPFLSHCVNRIEAAHGSIRVSDLERTTGLSARQIERKFAMHIGVSPKTFARVARFKAVEVAASNLNPPNWLRLANDLGFADQSHLVREFRAFSGLNPTQYWDSANQLL